MEFKPGINYNVFYFTNFTNWKILNLKKFFGVVSSRFSSATFQKSNLYV